VGGGFDHQFFNNKRLDELEKKEVAWQKFESSKDNEDGSDAKDAKAGKDLVEPPEFTEDDLLEQEALLKAGFSNWNKRDFYKFINMCELYGRVNIESFSELVGLGKSIEEIRAYSKCFWENFKKIDNYKKYIERIEKGENEIAKRQEIDKTIEDKFAQLFA